MAWVDFRHLLKDNTFEGEQAMCLDLIESQKIVVTAGKSCFSSEPGFFRICYAYPAVSANGDVTGAMKEFKDRLINWRKNWI